MSLHNVAPPRKCTFLSSNNIMSRRNELIRRLLSWLTDSELENLVRVREDAHPISVRRTPIPKPRRNVQQLIRYFENNPIPPYRLIPAPKHVNDRYFKIRPVSKVVLLPC